ncbi:MAG: TIGR03790 family protein, partial [Kiritimatiellae bacterium]|nr:TIGR03790 family protein [Kiritimatiellia bacterium]
PAVAVRSLALGPHETALVVNSESTASVLLGQTWARLRGVPEPCIVRVSIPRLADDSFPVALTHADFLEKIWCPATNALHEAGVDPQILAWAFSCDFPARVCVASNSPAAAPAVTDISLAGAVFLRGRVPDGQELSGAFRSPVFGETAQSLDRVRNKLLADYPLPSAMLAWTGARGLTLAEARAVLARAAAADRSSPSGTVFFAENGDVRWKTRAGPVAAVAGEMARFGGVEAVVATNLAGCAGRRLLGFFGGATSVPEPQGGFDFAAGAYADHMTSYAAAFDLPQQMKCAEWLRRGASFTSGTVAEPHAVWEKFPSARVFIHQLDGCTAIEALYAATAMPLQLQPVGDPLCAAWAPEISPQIEEIAGSAPRMFAAKLKGGGRVPRSWRCTWLLDGVQAASSASFTLPQGSSARRLRLVVRDDLRVRHQGWAEIPLSGE